MIVIARWAELVTGGRTLLDKSVRVRWCLYPRVRFRPQRLSDRLIREQSHSQIAKSGGAFRRCVGGPKVRRRKKRALCNGNSFRPPPERHRHSLPCLGKKSRGRD